MESTEDVPVVSLIGDLLEIDRLLGEALERHGCVSLVEHGLPPDARPETLKTDLLDIARILLEHLERYLGEHRVGLSTSIQGGPLMLFSPSPEPHRSKRPGDDPHALTLYAQRSGAILARTGELLEEWTHGRLKAATQRAVEDVRAILCIGMKPDTILRLMPRLTVAQYLERRFKEISDAQPKEST